MILNEGAYPFWAGWYHPDTERVTELGPREIHRDALKRLGVTPNAQGYIDLDSAFNAGWVRVSVSKSSEGIPSGIVHGGTKFSNRKAADWLRRNHPQGNGIPWTKAWIEWVINASSDTTSFELFTDDQIDKYISKGIVPRHTEKVYEKFRDESPELAPDIPLSKGPRLSRPLNRGRDFTAWMEQRGWNKIGQGGYADVFYSEKQPQQVLKVFHDDPGYIRFWAAAKNTDNPHFPEVSRMGRFAFVQDDQHVSLIGVLIEKLERVPPGENYDDLYDLVRDIRFYLSTSTRELPLGITQRYPELQSALDILKKINTGSQGNPKYRLDITGSNILWRGDLPVISDPFAWKL